MGYKGKKRGNTIFKIKEQEKLHRVNVKKYMSMYNKANQGLWGLAENLFGGLMPKMQVKVTEKRIQ